MPEADLRRPDLDVSSVSKAAKTHGLPIDPGSHRRAEVFHDDIEALKNDTTVLRSTRGFAEPEIRVLGPAKKHPVRSDRDALSPALLGFKKVSGDLEMWTRWARFEDRGRGD